MVSTMLLPSYNASEAVASPLIADFRMERALPSDRGSSVRVDSAMSQAHGVATRRRPEAEEARRATGAKKTHLTAG